MSDVKVDQITHVVVLLVTLAGSASAAGGIFDGCKVSEDKPGEKRIHCGDEFRATTSVEQPESASEALIDLMIRGLKEDRKAPATVERIERVVGGVKRRGVRYVNTREQGGVQGVYLIVPASAGKIRFIGCEEPALRRCEGALEALLHGGPTANQVTPQEQGFAGRPLKTQGCRAPQPRRLECEAARLNWEYPTADEPQGIDWIYEPMRKAFAQQGTVTELPRRTCKIDDAPAECRQLSVALPDGRTGHALVGIATLRGRRVYAQCNSTTSLGGARLPGPCDQVFHFAP